MQFFLRSIIASFTLFYFFDALATPIEAPIKPKTENQHISPSRKKPDIENKININLADSNLLQTIKGVGPKRAQAIIDYRLKNGPFSSIEDLSKVKGFNTHITAQIIKDNSGKLSIE